METVVMISSMDMVFLSMTIPKEGSMKETFKIIVSMDQVYSIFVEIYMLGSLLIISLKMKMEYLCGKMGIFFMVFLLTE